MFSPDKVWREQHYFRGCDGIYGISTPFLLLFCFPETEFNILGMRQRYHIYDMASLYTLFFVFDRFRPCVE